MKIALLAVSMLSAACAIGAEAEATIGAPGCKIVNPHPVPKERVKWSGACKDGYAVGDGHLEWFDNGAFRAYYKGSLERGLPQGPGYSKRSDGMEYEGQFQHGQRDGQGVMLMPNGDRYQGQWKADMPDGQGQMVYALGGSYDGQWRRGAYAGHGKAVFAGGQVVEGEFGHAKERAVPDTGERYSLKSDEKWDTYFKADIATGGDVPYDKSYAQMSAAQQNAIKARYALLMDGDEPPYPLQGTKRLFTWFSKALEKVETSGMLRLTVLVDSAGDAESVTVYATPHPDMSKLAAQIVMAEKYKPAVCSGKPCAMAFSYEIEFLMQ